MMVSFNPFCGEAPLSAHVLQVFYINTHRFGTLHDSVYTAMALCQTNSKAGKR